MLLTRKREEAGKKGIGSGRMCAVLQTMKITQQLSPVYTTQAVVKPVRQPVKCLYTRYNQLSNRMSNRFF